MPFVQALSDHLPKDGGRTTFWLCAGTLVCSLLLGGGTRGGFLSDAVLQLLSVPIFLISLAQLPGVLRERQEDDRTLRLTLMLCAAIALVPLIQLVPLPAWIWTNLPGRERELALLHLIGRGRLWMPISTSPTSTWLSALSLLPPFAIFLGTIQLSYRERRALSLIVLAMGILSAFVGLVQIAQGPSSALRFFAVTNDRDAVGFFANRNHFAAFLYVVLLFAAVWAVDGVSGQAQKGSSLRVLAVTASFLILMLLIAAEAMARSRAGLLLTAVALTCAFGLASAGRRAEQGITPGKLMVGATTLAIVLTIQYGLYRVADRFAADALQDTRIPIAHNTIEAARTFMPFGAGVGTFVPVYAMFESPGTTVAHMYVNHAHNDLLEVWLETGAAGILIIGLFVVWVATKAKVWWQGQAQARAIDHTLARAGIVAIGLLIAHSFVDYPLRTGALEGVFAFVCALLVVPPGGSEGERRVRQSAGDSAAHEESEIAESPSMAPPSPSPPPFPAQTLPPGSVVDNAEGAARRPVGHGGADIDWSERWRRQVERDPSRPA